jgi:hypothetical protein
MAIEKNIVIGADLSGLEKKLDELIEALKDSQKQADKTAESINDIADTTKDIGKSANESQKGIKGLGAGFKGLGVAIKAAGIGLLLEAMSILKELFDNNQKTVDFFNTTFNSLQVAFSDFTKWISGSGGAKIVDYFKAIFENPKQAVADLGQAIKDNIIERFNSLMEVLGFVGTALKKFFTGDFKGALDDVKAAGTEMVDVFTGVDGTVEKVVGGVKNVTKAVVDYTKETIKQGAAMTETNKKAEIAEVLAQGLIEKYDLQAEKLRQVRDDERFTIEERIKANNDLAKVLEEQEQVMLSNAQAVVDAKARQLSLDKDNIEFQKEYLAAVNELAGVQAQVAGFRSEQLMNEMALERELVDLEISKKENAQEVAELQAEAAIEAETNLFKQLEIEEALNQQLYEKRLEALELQKGLYVEGTQAYQDMVNEINVLNAERTAQEAEEGRKRTQIEQEVQDAKVDLAVGVMGSLNEIAQVFMQGNEKQARRAFNINKAVGIAEAVISTASGIAKALAQTTDPTPTQSLRFGNAIAVGLAGAAQVATIAAQQFNAGGGGGGSSSIQTPSAPTAPTATPRTPDFNVVGQSGTNALLESLQNKPMKAYVVGGEVSTQQQLDRKKVQTSSFG